MKDIKQRNVSIFRALILSLILISYIDNKELGLEGVHSTFENMFNNFSSLFNSKPSPIKKQIRSMKPETKSENRVSEVEFRDKDGKMKTESQIEKELATNFGINNIKKEELEKVMKNFEKKAAPKKTQNRKLKKTSQKKAKGSLENKIRKAMRVGLSGEVLSSEPHMWDQESVKKTPNWVEFDDSHNISDHLSKKVVNKNFKGQMKSKSWGRSSQNKRILKNGEKQKSFRKQEKHFTQRSGVTPDGQTQFQEASFTSQSNENSGGLPLLDIDALDMGKFLEEHKSGLDTEMKPMNFDHFEDVSVDSPFMRDMFFPEDEQKKFEGIQNRMIGNLDDLFVPAGEFRSFDFPRELSMKHKKRSKNKKRRKSKNSKKRSSKKKSAKRKEVHMKSTQGEFERELDSGLYDYQYPETIYGYNSHILQNPQGCPNCASSAFVPDMTVNAPVVTNQQQNNNYGYVNNQAQMQMNQANQFNNVQQNNVVNHHHHHNHVGAAFNPALESNVGLQDYQQMESLYNDYLEALGEFNNDIPGAMSHGKKGKHINSLQNQICMNHQIHPYFGECTANLPQMISPDAEMYMHLPDNLINNSIEPKHIIHHHYLPSSYSEYSFNGPSALSQPMIPQPLMQPVFQPSPVFFHNYELLFDEPHPSAPKKPAKPVKKKEDLTMLEVKKTRLDIEHVKEELEGEFKHEIEIEIGDIKQHEQELQNHTDEEIHQLMDLTRQVADAQKSPPQAPVLNVEHTVMGINGHSVHQTQNGEFVVENASVSHHSSESHGRSHGYRSEGSGDSSDSSDDSMETTVIQKITPILMGANGGFEIGEHGQMGNLLDESEYSDLPEEFEDHSENSESVDHSDPSVSHSYVSDTEHSDNTSVTDKKSNQTTEEIIIQRGPNTDNEKVVEVHDDGHGLVKDLDEDFHSKESSSSSHNVTEEQTHNQITNKKNTHIVHHMGTPDDSKTVNINLDLLTDGEGGFYFEGKDGKPLGKLKGIGQELTGLENKLDQHRHEELDQFNKLNLDANADITVGSEQNLSEISATDLHDGQIDTDVKDLEELHEVKTDFLRDDLHDQSSSEPQLDQHMSALNVQSLDEIESVVSEQDHIINADGLQGDTDMNIEEQTANSGVLEALEEQTVNSEALLDQLAVHSSPAEMLDNLSTSHHSLSGLDNESANINNIVDDLDEDHNLVNSLSTEEIHTDGIHEKSQSSEINQTSIDTLTDPNLQNENTSFGNISSHSDDAQSLNHEDLALTSPTHIDNNSEDLHSTIETSPVTLDNHSEDLHSTIETSPVTLDNNSEIQNSIAVTSEVNIDDHSEIQSSIAVTSEVNIDDHSEIQNSIAVTSEVNIDDHSELQESNLNNIDSEKSLPDLSAVSTNEDSLNKVSIKRNLSNTPLTQDPALKVQNINFANPFDTKIPIFESIGHNFLNEFPPQERTLQQLADDYDKQNSETSIPEKQETTKDNSEQLERRIEMPIERQLRQTVAVQKSLEGVSALDLFQDLDMNAKFDAVKGNKMLGNEEFEPLF